MKKLGRIIRRKKSVILAVLAVVGVIGTAVASSNDSRNADIAIDEEVNERGELTNIEKVKVAFPYYLTTIVVAGLTIACIISCHILNKKEQAALLAGYGGLRQYISKYQKKIQDEVGKEREAQIRKEVIDELASTDVFRYNSVRVVDKFLGREYSHLSLEDLYCADINCLRELSRDPYYLPLDRYYKYLGVPYNGWEGIKACKKKIAKWPLIGEDDIELDRLSKEPILFFEADDCFAPFDILYDYDYSDPTCPTIYIDFNMLPQWTAHYD